MSVIEALILGIIQGLTEFLPVSSSGHLELGKALLDLDMNAKNSVLFDVVVHAATALSTIVVFRKDIYLIFKGLFRFEWNEETQFSLLIVISMIPAAAVGLLFNDFIESLFVENVVLVSLMLIITAILLLLADRIKPRGEKVSYKSAFIIGIAQAIAILPGISRSGATIATSVFLGISRERTARFSFLMVVPLILGKMTKDIATEDILFKGEATLIVGVIAAFLTGILACNWMIGLVRTSKLKYFSYYCLAVSAAALSLKYIF